MVSIMIVEDEFLVRAGLTTCIEWEKEGFEVVAEAQNGEEALEKYNRLHPSIIITDIRLPKMDGLTMMRKIREQKETVGFIIISAYNDFQYAKEAINIGVENYFLKGELHPEALLNTLREMRTKYQLEGNENQRIWPKTLQGLYAKSGWIEKQTVDWKQKLSEVCLLHLKTDVSRTEMLRSEMLVAMVTDFFSRKGVQCWKLNSENGLWFIYENVEDDGWAWNELNHTFERYVDEKVVLAKTKTLSQYVDLKEAIYHVILLCEYQCNHGKKDNISVNESCDEKKEMQNIHDIIYEIIKSTKRQNVGEMLKLLEQMKETVINSRMPAALFVGVFRIVGVLAEHDVSISAAREYEKLLEYMDVNQIFSELSEYMKCIFDEKEKNSNVYILKVKEYVENNYQKPIRIKELSDYIHISPNYLGKIFYVNTGTYLKDYINSVKMEKAKELLGSKQYQVNEVAEMVGIEDQHYFSKMFKKFVGVSPTEYEKSI